MVWSSMTWKWPIPVLFCGMNHQKYKFSLISVSFSVGGCWGQNMLLFWKLVDETQIPQSQEYTDTFKQNLTCTFLPIRANLKYTLCHEGPCISHNVSKKVYFSFPDGGNKACNKIWQLISFDPARFSSGLNDTQEQDIVKTKIQVSRICCNELGAHHLDLLE